MPRALWLLLLWSLRGRLRRLARQLRRPRYLIAFLAGSAYLLWMWMFVIFRPGRGGVRVGKGAPDLGGLVGQEQAAFTVHLFVALGAALFVTFAWILLRARPRLTLNPAEIQTLLPAPLPRRQILAFALVRNQPITLFSALIFSVIRRDLLHLPALWAVITLVDWHFKGVTLWKVRCKEAPPLQRRLMRGAAVALFLVFWVAIGMQLGDFGRESWAAVEALQRGDVETFGTLMAGLPTTLVECFADGTGVLTVFLWLTAPFLPLSIAGGTATMLGWGLLAILISLQYLWVVSSPVRFEDAVLEAARRAERKRTGRRERPRGEARQRHPFPLPPGGRPEVAILWKNLLLVTRVPLRRVAGFCLGFCVLSYVAASALGTRVNLMAISMVVAFGLVMIFPGLTGMIFRMDLRHDLEKVELARCWPLPGWRLVLAEIAVPVLLSTLLALQGSLLMLAVALGTASRSGGSTGALSNPQLALLTLAAGVPLALGLAALSSILLNLFTLFFPSWVPLGVRPRHSGPANTGIAAILFLAHGAGMLLGLALAGLVAGTAVLLLVWAGAPTGLVVLLAGLLAAACLLAVAFALVVLAGRRWDDLDPSQELLAESG